MQFIYSAVNSRENTVHAYQHNSADLWECCWYLKFSSNKLSELFVGKTNVAKTNCAYLLHCLITADSC